MNPLHDALGQLLLVGFDGTALTPQLAALIRDLRLGGLIIFQRNVASPAALAALTADCQRVAREAGLPKLLIAIDQEGGRVARLRAGQGFDEFPSARAVASQGIAGVTQQTVAMAAQLRAAGINVNLAPVLDVNNNPANPVIGDRSFGDDAAQVTACGVAVVEALQANGVLAVAKHFPGHGDVAVDSHVALPIVPHGMERLAAVEFAPFVAAMRAGVAGIMSAHVAFPAIEPDGLPATLSRRVLTGLLRDALGYDGLVLTDSLEMGALATLGYPPPLAAVTAIAAGADIALFNSSDEIHRDAHAMLLRWIDEARIPRAQIERSLARVAAAKAAYAR
jgi:beta-N-acetylhexosaminidase